MSRKRHIVVTGGMGYVGSHTTIALLAGGYDVTILDDLSTSSVTILDGIREISGSNPSFHQVDLCDRPAFRLIWDALPAVDAVIHFAARKAVGESVEKPLLYYRNNLISLLEVLQAMQDRNSHALVFSSSCTVYGNPDHLPVTESTPRKEAQSPYGYTKMVCEDMIRGTAGASRLRAISLRYFNPIGAHPSGKIGELPTGVPDNLVPYITQTAQGLRDKLRVFGGDYDTPDGTCIRDYIHVMDVAEAHVAALNRLFRSAENPSHEVFNIGTGKGYSVKEMIGAFERVSGKILPHEIVARRKGDVEAIWADTSLANRELKWQARFDLDDMLASAWKWQSNISDEVTK